MTKLVLKKIQKKKYKIDNNNKKNTKNKETKTKLVLF